MTASVAGDAIAGTPLYMAPEAISRPDTVDGRSDLYARGRRRLLPAHGTARVRGRARCSRYAASTCSRRQCSPSRRLGKPLPADLEAIVLGCLEKDPGARPASAAALRTSLLACSGRRTHRPAGGPSLVASPPRLPAGTAPVYPMTATLRPATMAIDLGHRSTEGLRPARVAMGYLEPHGRTRSGYR